MTRSTIVAVIVQYGGFELTRDAVLSLAADGVLGCVIVDNCSPDKSFDSLCAWLREVRGQPLNSSYAEAGWVSRTQIRVLKAESNGGYGAGNNLGAAAVEHCFGEDCAYIWFLNNDVLVPLGTSKKLQSWMDTRSDIGFAGVPEMHLPDDGRMLNMGFRVMPLSLDSRPVGAGMTWAEGAACLREGVSIDYPSGAGWIFRRKVFNFLGKFDSRYFMYFEEMDMVARARLAGVRWAISDACHIHHVGNASAGGASSLRMYLIAYGSRLRYVRQHRSCSCFWAIQFWFRAMVRCIISRRWSWIPVICAFHRNF